MANVIIESYRYTVEPLYQWDSNQDLVIKGLSVPGVPEIHFANAEMERAIVRQAVVDEAGIISVQVPNSLLQKASKITAYVCMYEGESFKSLYAIEIAVKARKKPSDYVFEDTDGEIYSYNALENMVVNAINKMESDRADTLAEVKSATDKAIQDLNDENAEFLGDLIRNNETLKTEIMDDVSDLMMSNQPLSHTVEGTKELILEDGSIGVADYVLIYSRQGNVMNLTVKLGIPEGAFGVCIIAEKDRPDWFLLPMIETLNVPGASSKFTNDYMRIQKNSNVADGFVLWCLLDIVRATTHVGADVISFNTTYIVVDN